MTLLHTSLYIRIYISISVLNFSVPIHSVQDNSVLANSVMQQLGSAILDQPLVQGFLNLPACRYCSAFRILMSAQKIVATFLKKLLQTFFVEKLLQKFEITSSIALAVATFLAKFVATFLTIFTATFM